MKKITEFNDYYDAYTYAYNRIKELGYIPTVSDYDSVKTNAINLFTDLSHYEQERCKNV